MYFKNIFFAGSEDLLNNNERGLQMQEYTNNKEIFVSENGSDDDDFNKCIKVFDEVPLDEDGVPLVSFSLMIVA